MEVWATKCDVPREVLGGVRLSKQDKAYLLKRRDAHDWESSLILLTQMVDFDVLATQQVDELSSLVHARP